MAERPYRLSHPISLRIPSDLSRISPRVRSVLATIEPAVALPPRPDSDRSAGLQPGLQPARIRRPNVGCGQTSRHEGSGCADRRPVRESGFLGRLAQRERNCLTSSGSGVQIPRRPPAFSQAARRKVRRPVPPFGPADGGSRPPCPECANARTDRTPADVVGPTMRKPGNPSDAPPNSARCGIRKPPATESPLSTPASAPLQRRKPAGIAKRACAFRNGAPSSKNA